MLLVRLTKPGLNDHRTCACRWFVCSSSACGGGGEAAFHIAGAASAVNSPASAAVEADSANGACCSGVVPHGLPGGCGGAGIAAVTCHICSMFQEVAAGGGDVDGVAGARVEANVAHCGHAPNTQDL